MRVPVVATAVVALAVSAMVALGAWQLLVRLPEKETELAQLARNPALPVIAFPTRPDDRLLFRRATLTCRAPVMLSQTGAGRAGYRTIATCAGGEKVQLGTSRTLNFFGQTSNVLVSNTEALGWDRDRVTGRVSHAPDPRPLIAKLFDHTPQTLILIADTPAPGLTANPTPDWRIVPNNHLSYAVQWFLFAGIAALIYALALRRRGRA